MELDQWATKYREAMDKSDKYAKQAKRYREKIKAWLVERNRREAVTLHWKIRRSVFNRAYMTKKETPTEIWRNYAISKEFDAIHVHPKKVIPSTIPSTT